jgi:hypothetical protein
MKDVGEVVTEQGEWFSIRTPGADAPRGGPQNEALFTRELRTSGSAIVTKARGGEGVWLAWLVPDDYCEDQLLQSCSRSGCGSPGCSGSC